MIETMGSSSDDIMVAAWLAIRDSRLLVFKSYNASVWFLPGGLPEPGETLKEAASREAEEETCIRVRPDQLHHLVDVTAPAWGRDGEVDLVCFADGGSVMVSEPRPGEEISEIGWISSVDWHGCAPAIQVVVDYLRQETLLD